MLQMQLHTSWKMRRVGDETFLPAVVPGSVYQDLLLNGRMEDPYYRDNELQALELMKEDYEYSCSFSASSEFLECQEVVLHFDGLDTVADIYLNNNRLGDVRNMHRCFEFPVKELLCREDNELRIHFHSPVNYIREEYESRKDEGTSDAMKGFPLLRKAHCMFGWDWGPRLPDAGIWRSVALLGIGSARLESVYIQQKHENGNVTLEPVIEIQKTGSARSLSMSEAAQLGYSCTVIMTTPEGMEQSHECGSIPIENPRLWWPSGYGEQPLYGIKVTLYHQGQRLDEWERRIGLRTMEMRIEKDSWGESFAHVVNGIPIFAMGADYIPEDNILSRTNKERTRDLLLQCQRANFNTIRIWGGGHYPSDDFFDLCDELGLVVWEDFMFACAEYTITEDFEENIKAEFIDNIRRIRHHASLGLWCGNNEMEMFVDVGLWSSKATAKSEYIKLFEYILPKLVKQHDPQTFYWPASPSSGGGFDQPNDPSRGDVHYWDVWHGNKPFTEYRKFNFRYLSEFGFQSFPTLKTVESFTLPEDRNIFSYVMEKHQRNNAANGKIMEYMSQTFLYPTSFDTLLYASQLLQAEAIRYGVEHFRRLRGCCMGTVYWQLNDCWPVASWSSIDYYGRWKALHYYAKRFFAPIMISCEEEGILTQDTNVNAEPYEVKKSIRFNIANETMSGQSVEVVWSLRSADGTIKRSERQTVTVEPLSSLWLDKIELPQAELYRDYVSYEACVDGTSVSGGTVIFSIPKHFQYDDPHLECSLDGEWIVVRAKAYAKSVEILNENEDLVLEDNYFDMNKGERRVRIISGEPMGLKLRSVYDIR